MECFNRSSFSCDYFLTNGDSANVGYPKSGQNPNINFFVSAPPYINYKSAYNIGYFYWEAKPFPSQWKNGIRLLDEIWAPCGLVADCARDMGFSGKIKIVPTPMRKINKSRKMINFAINDGMVISEKCFKFYSIFQWQYRKGFDVLLSSYFNTFSSKDNVVLILKVNKLHSDDFRGQINKAVKNAKRRVGYKKFAPIIVIDYFIDNDKMDALHRFGDCFVLPHRGEGWGMPIARAIMHDNHVITTKYGGITEYLDNDCANIISHSETPVSNMQWCNLYSGNQIWAEPDPISLSNNMKNLYLNEKDYLFKIINANHIKEKISMESFIDTIERELVKI